MSFVYLFLHECKMSPFSTRQKLSDVLMSCVISVISLFSVLAILFGSHKNIF